MQIDSLDHVALWVEDRDDLAEFLTNHVGMHVIERTDSFTIVGSDARRGKLTLFAAEGTREPGPLARIVLHVADLERALDALPNGLNVERGSDQVARFEGPQLLGLGLAERDGVDYDIDHVTLLVSDRDAALSELSGLGFTVRDGRAWAGDAYLWLEEGKGGEPERPLLNHFGLRVASADEHLQEAQSRGLDIADVVDAANTYAVFIWGPERIKLEYVEHKASFSLV
jgi:catechol 2,3-dioxygenase-like lactoylglutathione lyase family enzyme